jgi:hypothetical protein
MHALLVLLKQWLLWRCTAVSCASNATMTALLTRACTANMATTFTGACHVGGGGHPQSTMFCMPVPCPVTRPAHCEKNVSSKNFYFRSVWQYVRISKGQACRCC